MSEVAQAVASTVNDIAQKTVSSVIRSVSIHLKNKCRSNILINPQVYTSSGYSYDPPQPTVRSGDMEVCAFGHTKGTARGAVGVLTYDLTEDRKQKAVKRLAIMFSVPFNSNLHENWFSLGLLDIAQACDASLFELMYYQEDENKFRRGEASGSEICFQGSAFTLRGTMCPVGNAEIKMELWDSSTSTRLHTACKQLRKLSLPQQWIQRIGGHSFASCLLLLPVCLRQIGLDSLTPDKKLCQQGKLLHHETSDMEGTDAAQAVASYVSELAQKTVSSANRSVSIHLKNKCRSNILVNPQVYTFSGHCHNPPHPTVRSGDTEVCTFGQTKGAACGAVGVLTYDITEDRDRGAVKRLAIMFSVPFDYNLYQNWFALGLFDTEQECDKHLYELMYYKNDDSKFKRAKAAGSEISFQDCTLTLRGTMSPVKNSEMNLELWDGGTSTV